MTVTLDRDVEAFIGSRGSCSSTGNGATRRRARRSRRPTRVLHLASARANDVVVRRIFDAGLDLQVALGLIGDHSGASKIYHALDELDQAIKDIRDTIFDRSPPSSPRFSH